MKDNFSAKLIYSVLVLFFISTISLIGQSSQIRENAPNVFIDCEDCDMDHIRTEISFVNFVTETKESDIHIIVITQTTSGEGRLITLFFIGQREYSGKSDTLNYALSGDATLDMRREKLNHYLKIGLVPFIKSNEMLDRMKITYQSAPKDILKPEIKTRDWTYKIRLYGWGEGEKYYRHFGVNSTISAEKITREKKQIFYSTNTLVEKRYTYPGPDGYRDTIQQSSHMFQNLTVYSISDHWSLGFGTVLLSSTLINTDFQGYIRPAIEYNIFPYDEATRKQLRISYGIGPQLNIYKEETIYDKYREFLIKQNLEIAAEVIQEWGRVSAYASYYSFLHNLSFNYLSVGSSINLRVLKGLELGLSGNYSFIRDQIYLAKGNLEPQDVIHRIKTLKTSYKFSSYITITYTFGNLYSNVVNPRFGN